LIAPKAFEKDYQESGYELAIIAKESILSSSYSLEFPSRLKPLLEEFLNIMPNEFSSDLPHMRYIQHAIDLVLGSQLSNLPHYRKNPKGQAKLNKQVKDLLTKGFDRHSLSPCAVPSLLTPKER